MAYFNAFAPSLPYVDVCDPPVGIVPGRARVIALLLAALAAAAVLGWRIAITTTEQCEIIPGPFSAGFSDAFQKTRCAGDEKAVRRPLG